MKIIVDMAHPANVHYFRNFISEMEKRGHEVLITSRDKDVSHKLLKSYRLDYVNMGSGTIGKGAIGKLLYIIYATVKMFGIFRKFKPDVVVSFAATYAAFNCFLFRKPHITFEDTEHAKMNKFLYKPFTEMIITPKAFYLDMGKNHYKMNAYMELFYLHPNVFTPKKEILNKYGINPDEKFILFRYVSWGAFHDIGQNGINDEDRDRLIEEASKNTNVYVSSEGPLPEKYKEYELKIDPSDIHHILAFAVLYIGEGGTMASECAMLGTPSIYVNSLALMGYLKDAEKANLLYHKSDTDEIIKLMNSIFNNEKFSQQAIMNRNELIEDKIEPTSFLVELIENYPDSREKLIAKKVIFKE